MIKEIQFDSALCAKLNLAEVHMEQLSEVVAITGPNGAGKTRLLKVFSSQWERLARKFGRLIQNTKVKVPPLDPSEEEGYRRAIQEQISSISIELSSAIKFQETLGAMVARGKWPVLVHISTVPEFSVRFKGETASAFPQKEGLTLDEAACDDFMSSHPQWAAAHEDAIRRSEAFRHTVSTLLKVRYGWKEKTRSKIVATFDDREVDEHELSAGQRTVIRWCQLIHENTNDLSEAIILIDEPELHLHSALLLETFERLRSLKPAQIWVATHSLSLLAHIGARNVFEMRNGCVQWAGNDILKVQRGLLGDDGVARLRGFLSDAASLAFHQFAAECLVAPSPVSLRKLDDPQAKQLVSHIREALESGVETHVLDYAAGSGRLVEALAAVDPQARTNLRYHVYCSAKHTTPEERLTCREHLARLHPDLDRAILYHEDLRVLRLSTTTKMHAVVLCNVLHEIPPSDWPSLMQDIRQCLRADGTLVVLEDQRMSVGELPHDKGYLVLDEVELPALFALNEHERREIRFDWMLDDRLSMAQVPARFLDRCNPGTVDEALKNLLERALAHIVDLRSPAAGTTKPPHHRGREHAYYAMLYTNATLALGRLRPG